MRIQISTSLVLRGEFVEGSPVSSLVAFALESSWAKTALPWGVYLRRAFPKQAGEPRERVIHLPDVLWPVGDTIRVSQSEKNSNLQYMLTTVDMRSVPPKRCSSMVMWCNVVVLEQPATTYRELPPAGWTSPIFHAAPQQPEVLKEDEAITKEFHRSALSIQVDFGRYRPGGIWAALMIFSTVYLCISTVYCISLFGWSQLWGLFFFRLYVIHGVISCSKWVWV